MAVKSPAVILSASQLARVIADNMLQNVYRLNQQQQNSNANVTSSSASRPEDLMMIKYINK